MNTVPEALKEKFQSWTKGLTPVALMHPNSQTLIFVGKKNSGTETSPRPTFDVIRFFTLGSNWEVSCDARDESAENAFKEIARGVSPLGFIT